MKTYPQRRLLAPALVALAVAISSVAARGSDCADGARSCSPDALTAKVCEAGAWKEISCMADSGMLCEDGKCVEPWKYGAPKWPKADAEPLAGGKTLAEKAARYEEISERLHIHPELKWMMGLELPCGAAVCDQAQAGKDGCGACKEPGVSEDVATRRDVERWHSGENDGLFSALYLAAEAFRYGTTRDPAALKMIKLLLDGEITRMKITGVPGLFTRQYIPPGIKGLNQPANKESYYPDREKDDNKWVRVDENGFVNTISPETGEWVVSSHNVGKEFAGWVWLDNVSKDEYSGHIFALGAVVKLVDDPEAQAIAKDLLAQVGRHMIKNKMAFTDWDGRVAEHGRINAITLGDYPGFNAAMGLDFIKVAAVATGDERITKWYDDCLMQKSGRQSCIKAPMEKAMPYTEHLSMHGLYVGEEGCKSNYNNLSMHMLSLHNLIWFERDPALRGVFQDHFDREVFRAVGQPRAMMNQNNAFFDIIWASQKKLGPDSDGPAFAAVENAIKMLKQFPASQRQEAVQCPPDKCAPYCKNRFKSDEGGYAREVAERCAGGFVWWGDPYSLSSCGENHRMLHSPTGYLLPYWMGRYYGFISGDM